MGGGARSGPFATTRILPLKCHGSPANRVRLKGRRLERKSGLSPRRASPRSGRDPLGHDVSSEALPRPGVDAVLLRGPRAVAAHRGAPRRLAHDRRHAAPAWPEPATRLIGQAFARVQVHHRSWLAVVAGAHARGRRGGRPRDLRPRGLGRPGAVDAHHADPAGPHPLAFPAPPVQHVVSVVGEGDLPEEAPQGAVVPRVRGHHDGAAGRRDPRGPGRPAARRRGRNLVLVLSSEQLRIFHGFGSQRA